MLSEHRNRCALSVGFDYKAAYIDEAPDSLCAKLSLVTTNGEKQPFNSKTLLYNIKKT